MKIGEYAVVAGGRFMEIGIRKIWRAIRTLVKENFTFVQIKDMVAAAALPVEELDGFQQNSFPAKGASKLELIEAVDELIARSSDPRKAIQNLVEVMIERRGDLQSEIESFAKRFDWTVMNGRLQPLDFQVDNAVDGFSEEARNLLKNAYRRFGEEDYSGAMTAICSALDNVTNHLYDIHSLGKPQDDSYQQKVSRSFAELETAYRYRFSQITDDNSEVTILWSNYRKAINQAAYVMGSFRRNASDVHGISTCPPEIIRHAIDCGTFIIRSLTSEISGSEKEDDLPDF